ncbi:MAG TPA: ORF6N domain-containing protein [bacterium]|nr:ORF6N domain-containing protein [bacterium]
MLDSDLAELYGVSTKVFNQAVKRNTDRFPERYMFTLIDDEFVSLRSQFVTSNKKEGRGGRRYLPNVFTEQGVAMLSAVLKSETAIQISIKVIDAFVEMRRFILENARIFQRLEFVEKKQIEFKSESDKKFDILFKALENNELHPKQGIFFEGQVFEAHKFVSDIVRSAEKSIILIDNYVDDTVLTLFSKRKQGVALKILTKNLSKQLQLDTQKFNEQFPPAEIKEFNHSHDRFLIIDGKDLYHFGASLKDLGRKWFGFSKMDVEVTKMVTMVSV